MKPYHIILIFLMFIALFFGTAITSSVFLGILTVAQVFILHGAYRFTLEK